LSHCSGQQNSLRECAGPRTSAGRFFLWKRPDKVRKVRDHNLHTRDLLKIAAKKSPVDATPSVDRHLFDDVPGHLIRCARQISLAIFIEEMASFNVTSVQYALLASVNKNAGADQRTLVNSVAIDRSTIGTTLTRLERAGLVFRASPKHNKRIKQVFLTRAGEQLLHDSSEAILRVQERLMKPFDPEEKAQFMRLMAKLVEENNELSRVPLKPKKGKKPPTPAD
jgi:MarR family transcriptional regulator, lower aerobic nicotinate degradation pathway regulator